MRIPGTCVVAVSVGDIILRVEVVVVVRGRGGVPGARPLCGHQAAAVQVTSVKTYPNNYCIATLLCKTPHCYTTLQQIRHNLCLRLLKLSPTDTPRHTTIRHQPFHQSVVSHSEIPSLFVFFDSVYFIVSKVCIWWQFWFGRLTLSLSRDYAFIIVTISWLGQQRPRKVHRSFNCWEINEESHRLNVEY